MSKLLSDEELAKYLADQEGYSNPNNLHTQALVKFVNTQKRLYADRKKLGLIDKLNKGMFYSDANPSGQHVKNCLMAEYDALQPMPQSQIEQIEYGKFRRAEQRARIE